MAMIFQMENQSGYDKIGGENEKDELKGGDSHDLFICDKKDHIIDFSALLHNYDFRQF